MDAQNFAQWLQGFAELNAEPPTKEQWQSIREHLQTVFTKVTPPVQLPVKPTTDHDLLRKYLDQANKQKRISDGPIC